MKTNLKKIAALIFAAVFVFCLAACGGEQQKVSVIGISQYGEHESLDNCRLGFLQGLKDAGLVEGTDYTIDYQNAGFDDNIAKQIAESFSANNVALMCGIATTSATACYAAAEDKNIPVIFTAITDPVQAKLDTGNVTGTSDKLAVEGQLELIRALQPEAKTIGILYTTSEPNSVSAIAEYKEKVSRRLMRQNSINSTMNIKRSSLRMVSAGRSRTLRPLVSTRWLLSEPLRPNTPRLRPLETAPIGLSSLTPVNPSVVPWMPSVPNRSV